MLWVLAGVATVAGLYVWHVEQQPLASLLVSAGLIAVLVSMSPTQRPTALSVEAVSGSMTFVDDLGGTAVLPRSAIAGVNVITKTGSDGDGSQSKAFALQLNKRDGGFMEVATWSSREEPRRIADAIGQVMAATGDSAPEEAGDPLGRLAGARAVHGRRLAADAAAGYRQHAGDAEGPLEVTWPALRGGQALLAPLFALATAVPIVAFAPHDVGVGIWIILGLFGLFGVVGLVFSLREVGVTYAVVVDAEQVCAERRRGARVVGRKAVPLSQVVSVDMDIMAKTLTVRPQDAHQSHAQSVAAAANLPREPSAAQVSSIVGSALRAQRLGVSARVASLGLADALNLDLVISAEVERRVGAPAGTM